MTEPKNAVLHDAGGAAEIPFATLPATTTVVEVSFREEGWHCWPGAPDRRRYLRDRHRHIFHINVAVLVDHQDRMIEFHDLIDWARNAWHQHIVRGPERGDMGTQSCEQMAQALGDVLILSMKVPVAYVSVAEDGEVTSIVYWPANYMSRMQQAEKGPIQ